jgi:ribosomal protein S18 acetylase RimI-like enzyme
VTRAVSPPAFALPAALLSEGFALRPETDADLPFLRELFASTREEELATVPWSAEQKRAFLLGQFNAQRHHYRTYNAGCAFDVIEHRGGRAGRLYLEEERLRLYIVDITLMPGWRGRGLGTAMLSALQECGRASGRSIGIMVEKFNPAMRLYRRLGFTDLVDHGVYQEMEWRPAGAQLNVA